MGERESRMAEQAKNIGLGRYFAKQERINLLLLIALAARAQDCVKEYEKTKINKVVLGFLKCGFGFIDRFLAIRMHSVQGDERKSLERELVTTEVGCVQAGAMKKERAEMAKLNNIVPVEYNDMCRLLEGCMEGNCANCIGKGAKVEVCEIKAMYHKYKVPVFDADAPVGVCPYRYEAVPVAS